MPPIDPHISLASPQSVMRLAKARPHGLEPMLMAAEVQLNSSGASRATDGV
jgi:hypothetical protein